jgi:hypothetical protein
MVARTLQELLTDISGRLDRLERRRSSGGGGTAATPLPNRLGGPAGDIATLPPATNLNSVTATGWYIQRLSAESTVALNYPINRAGHLEVSGGLMGTGADLIMQTYTEYAPVAAGAPARQWRRTHYNGTWEPWAEVAASGYLLYDTLYFTANGSFTKAAYPGLRAVKVKAQAAGGSGGGAATTSASSQSYGSGGGGGGYAEAFLLASALGTSVAVTVPPLTLGVTGLAGVAGGDASFGTAVVATGGGGGLYKPNSTLGAYLTGGAAGVGTAGDLLLGGQGGASGGALGNFGNGGNGGSSPMGGGGGASGTGAGNGNAAGWSAAGYGGGGGGAAANASSPTARVGGSGAPGIVIVELYR